MRGLSVSLYIPYIPVFEMHGAKNTCQKLETAERWAKKVMLWYTGCTRRPWTVLRGHISGTLGTIGTAWVTKDASHFICKFKMIDYLKFSMSYGFAFFAPLKSSFVCNLITATKYHYCQMQMSITRLSILFIFSLFLSFFLSLSISVSLSLSLFFSFSLSQFPCGL
jgi:hypothetical protein